MPSVVSFFRYTFSLNLPHTVKYVLLFLFYRETQGLAQGNYSHQLKLPDLLKVFFFFFAQELLLFSPVIEALSLTLTFIVGCSSLTLRSKGGHITRLNRPLYIPVLREQYKMGTCPSQN